MKFKVFFALLFILFFSAADVHATAEDSAKKEVSIPTVIRYIEGNAFLSPRVFYHSPDTTLDDLQIVNPAYRSHYNYLSNIGSAASPQEFVFQKSIFTDAGFHSYDLYLFNDESIRYFKTNKAYSELNYHLGGGKEQQITVALSQNILKNWNAGLDFNRLGSTGFLKNGTTFHSNIDLYTWFHSINNRYNLLASAYWNTIENKVNGGLGNDSIYDNNSLSNLALQGLLVNLADAENHFRNHKFSISQFYDLGFHTEEKITDSTKKIHFKPSARIGHSISLEERSFTYSDFDPGTYYKNTYFTSFSRDSLHYYDLRNRISMATLANRKNSTDSLRSFYYSFGLEHQWLRYSQTVNADWLFQDTLMHNVSAFAGVNNEESENKLHWKAAWNYVFAGVNKENYKGEASIHTTFNQFGTIDLSGEVLQKSPELIYQYYYSNHFIWENSFEKSLVKKARVEYSYPAGKLSLGAEVTSISKFIFLDSTALPVQSQNEIRVLKYFLNKNFHFGKFHFNNSLIMQNVNDPALHLPSLISTQSLYYESFFYKNVLHLQAGFDLHFNSSYYADAFMPATGLFYWQNEKKTGGFPLVDFFIKFRIKSARIFLKFENIGDDIFGTGYYLTPHYPMQGMTLQFGVNWRFFDQ